MRVSGGFGLCLHLGDWGSELEQCRKISEWMSISPCDGRHGACEASQHWWFSGRILACHAGGPGSIPGQCIFFVVRITIDANSQL